MPSGDEWKERPECFAHKFGKEMGKCRDCSVIEDCINIISQQSHRRMQELQETIARLQHQIMAQAVTRPTMESIQDMINADILLVSVIQSSAMIEQMAKYYWRWYQSFIAVGFSKEEAIQLIKDRPNRMV